MAKVTISVKLLGRKYFNLGIEQQQPANTITNRPAVVEALSRLHTIIL